MVDGRQFPFPQSPSQRGRVTRALFILLITTNTRATEYIKDLGLNWMDFLARQYDPQIGRFLAVDPLADAGGQQVWSPYAAMGNAPESNVDPDGTFSRNLTQADLSAADMLTYNRPVFFPTASLYMPGGALFKSGISTGVSPCSSLYMSPTLELPSDIVSTWRDDQVPALILVFLPATGYFTSKSPVNCYKYVYFCPESGAVA